MVDMKSIQPQSPQGDGHKGRKKGEIKLVNPAGNWEAWSPKMKDALKRAANSKQLGQEVVFENDTIRIWDIHLEPGEVLDFHHHSSTYSWTVMDDGKAIAHYGDGSIYEVQYQRGQSQYFDSLSEENYFIHNLINTGDTALVFCTVEYLSK